MQLLKTQVKGALLRFSVDNITPEKNTLTITAPASVKIEYAHKQGTDKIDDDMMRLHQQHAEHVIITIPRNTSLTEPIILHSKTAQSSFETITLIAEEHAAATILEIAESANTGYCRSAIINVIAKEQAHIQYVAANNLHESTYAFIKKEGSVARAASIQWVDVNLGSAFTQLKTTTHLHEEGAAATNSTAYCAFGKQAYDMYIRTEHHAPRAVSNMVSKGILNGNARTFIKELIKIQKPGTKSIGHQHQDILLIGDSAKADAIPTLEVDNDDVIASHGTSVGQLDEDMLFYAQSRGMSNDEAQKLIIEGFLKPVTETIRHEAIKQKIEELIISKIQ